MASIIISSDDPELGQAIAADTAEALGHALVDQSLLSEAASRFGIERETLERVLDPNSARRFLKRSYELELACIESIALEKLLEENVVCTGLAAHLYVRGVSHVLMIRVLAGSEAIAGRIAASQQISHSKALKRSEKRRKRHARWSLHHYGIDEHDASLYDMVFSLNQIEKDKVVDILADMAGYRKFEPMTYSRKILGDLALSAKVAAALLPEFPGAKISADGAEVIVHVTCPKKNKAETASLIKEKAGQVRGVERVIVQRVASKRELKKLPRQATSAD